MLKDNETFELKYPREIEGRRYERLTLRRPLVEDFLIKEEMTGSEFKKDLHFFANIAGVTPGVIQKLDYVDHQRLTARIATVFQEAQEAQEAA